MQDTFIFGRPCPQPSLGYIHSTTLLWHRRRHSTDLSPYPPLPMSSDQTVHGQQTASQECHKLIYGQYTAPRKRAVI